MCWRTRRRPSYEETRSVRQFVYFFSDVSFCCRALPDRKCPRALLLLPVRSVLHFASLVLQTCFPRIRPLTDSPASPPGLLLPTARSSQIGRLRCPFTSSFSRAFPGPCAKRACLRSQSRAEVVVRAFARVWDTLTVFFFLHKCRRTI